jgi:rfaE bifunctional protein kinase chain/domain
MVLACARPFEDEMQRQESLVDTIAAILEEARDARKIVFVSGNFNVLHPGHLRLLNFAKDCGDFLVVGVFEDGNGSKIHVPEHLRLEAVQALSVVDYAFVLRVPAERFIAMLKPTVVVKGKDREAGENPEREVVESYGGKLFFGSGEVRFSSLDLLQKELLETNFSAIRKPDDYPARHGFSVKGLASVVRKFTDLNVVVMGDLIVDEYINCEPLGMSQEDPTVVVTPIRSDRFVGGAGIVAAHTRGLGAQVKYIYVAGDDEMRAYADEMLSRYGVDGECIVDESRPTTLKQRYRAQAKTLLRVSHLRQHDIPQEVAELVLEKARDALADADLLMFSDFNYGCLPQALVEELTAYCRQREIMMVADSQSSSQVSDVSRFKGMRLLTPTEREARLATRDFGSGLVVLAEALRRKADAEHVILTLGSEGLLVQVPDPDPRLFATDQLPAFNSAPKDTAGAGDSVLACTSMALAVGADIWQSAYLGSVAAALQVSRVGNTPLTAHDLLKELTL